MKWRTRVVTAAAILCTVGCDQVTKRMAIETLAGRPGRSFLGGTVRLVYAENPGAFLGLGAGLPAGLRTALFTVVTGGLLTALFLLIRRGRYHGRAGLGLTLFFAGGMSNWMDRVAYGSVVDFLNVGVGVLRTGIFNVADIAIVAGAVLAATAGLGTPRQDEEVTAGTA